MALGMSGLPGAFAHPHVVGVIVTVPAPASYPRMEENLVVDHQDKQSSATSLCAQVNVVLLQSSLFSYHSYPFS